MRFAALFLSLCIATVGAARADTVNEAYNRAERELRRSPAEERPAVAAARCHEAVEQRRGEIAAPWCTLAAANAYSAMIEGDIGMRQTALDAAWMQAMDGVGGHNAAFFLRELAPGGPDATGDVIRSLAFEAMRERRWERCNPNDSYQILAQTLGLPALTGDTLGAQRAQLLDALLAREPNATNLWAVVATAVNARCERRDLIDDPEPIRRAVAETVARIAQTPQQAAAFQGQDGALAPVLSMVISDLQHDAGDYATAEATASAAVQSCAERIWAESDVCLQLAYRAATDRIMAARRAAQPEGDLPRAPHRVAGQMFDETGTPNAYCRAVYLVDVDDNGTLTNRRLVFESPALVCREPSERYVSRLRYEARSAERPNEWRKDLIIAFALRPD